MALVSGFLKLERQVAIEAVRAACRSSVLIQKDLCTEETINKKDKSPVTIADFASQALVIKHIRTHFPEDIVVGEESGKVLQKNPAVLAKLNEVISKFWPGGQPDTQTLIDTINVGAQKVEGVPKRWWTLDPVDGTLGFLRKGQYAVALALMEDEKPILGVLGCPSLPLNIQDPDGPKGCLFVAVRGQGTRMQVLENEKGEEEEAKVNDVTEGKDIILTESFESSHSAHDVSASLSQFLGIQKPSVRIDSQCKYGLVARGDVSFYFRFPSAGYVEKVWDHAAGALVVEEAGGKVTDMRGNPIRFFPGGLSQNLGLLVTNQKIHSLVLKAVEKIVGPSL